MAPLRWSQRGTSPAFVLLLTVTLILVALHSFAPLSQDRLSSLHPWKPDIVAPAPLFQQGHHQHVPDDLPPPIPGYGAISSPNNPFRNRFFVPLFACNEQETGSQMHTRQLLHLANALNRTLVLPNWGFGIPTLSNCRQYSFEDIYETERANKAGLWNVAYPTFKRFVERKGRNEPLDSRMTMIFHRDSHKYMGELVAPTDEETLRENCVDPEPFEFLDAAFYLATRPNEHLSKVVHSLRDANHVEVMFSIFNHMSDFFSPGFEDSLPQARPRWGLWSGNSWPMWNFSSSIENVHQYGRNKLPTKYAALQWRMELIPPHTLQHCADLFAEAVISGARAKGYKTIYVASDMPIGEEQEKKHSKSASFNPPEVREAMSSLKHLLYRLHEAEFKIVTWDDIMPPDGEPNIIEGLAEGANGIFDKLVLGGADWLFAANPYCGFKSSYLGSIQTLRQDRIGDTLETDWEKLGVTWVGKHISETFWWNLDV